MNVEGKNYRQERVLLDVECDDRGIDMSVLWLVSARALYELARTDPAKVRGSSHEDMSV